MKTSYHLDLAGKIENNFAIRY